MSEGAGWGVRGQCPPGKQGVWGDTNARYKLLVFQLTSSVPSSLPIGKAEAPSAAMPLLLGSRAGYYAADPDSLPKNSKVLTLLPHQKIGRTCKGNHDLFLKI